VAEGAPVSEIGFGGTKKFGVVDALRGFIGGTRR
jgi:hypothetical protein